MFDGYYCIETFFHSETLEKMLRKNLFSFTYNGAERYVTWEHYENAVSRANNNFIWTSRIAFATVHVTDDYVRFYDSPGMIIPKTAKLCINSTWIALLIIIIIIHGFVPINNLWHSILWSCGGSTDLKETLAIFCTYSKLSPELQFGKGDNQHRTNNILREANRAVWIMFLGQVTALICAKPDFWPSCTVFCP